MGVNVTAGILMQFISNNYAYILGTVVTLSTAGIILGRRFFLDGVFNNGLSADCAKKDLSGHYAIVTGANRGIGYAITKSLVQRGCHVVLACRSESRAKEAMESFRQRFGMCVCFHNQHSLFIA